MGHVIMVLNSAKAHWTLLPPGDCTEWDGLMDRFVRYVKAHPEYLMHSYIKTWYGAATRNKPDM